MNNAFSINLSKLKPLPNQLQTASTHLLDLSHELEDIRDSLDSSLSTIRPDIDLLVQATINHSIFVEKLSDVLQCSINTYESCEVSVLANIHASNTVYLSDGSTNLKPDPRGSRTGIPVHDFVRIVDENGDTYYGGDQKWFSDDPIKLASNGCGVIAAINEALYLAGVREISQADYIKLVEEYFKQDPSRKDHINSNIGAWPSDIGEFVSNYCKDKKLSNTPTNYNYSWSYITNDYEGDYKYMKEATKSGTPVVWALHNQSGENIGFYEMSPKTGNLEPSSQQCHSHYVSVTGVWEKQNDDGSVRRLIEISSGGKRYYVDYDEYKKFAKIDSVEDILNLPGNGVLKIEKAN